MSPAKTNISTTELRRKKTHRLIPARFSESGTVLSRLTQDELTLAHLAELDGATNERLLGEEGLLPGISVHELVYGIGYAHIVNAAFTHAAPYGGRFNSRTRGAWYCAEDRRTSLEEVAFHKRLQLEEIDWQDPEASSYDEYLASFAAAMHDLTEAKSAYRKFLKPQPIPDCYAAPQQLAADLLLEQSNGIVYPSVRHSGGTCIACFRPALVYDVRWGARLELTVRASETFDAKRVREISRE